MKVSREKAEFSPVVITLESETEVQTLVAILNNVSYDYGDPDLVFLSNLYAEIANIASSPAKWTIRRTLDGLKIGKAGS